MAMIALRGLALNLASTHEAENSAEIFSCNKSKQLLIAIVDIRCVSCVSTGYKDSKFFEMETKLLLR